MLTKQELEKCAAKNPYNSIGDLARWLLEEKFYLERKSQWCDIRL